VNNVIPSAKEMRSRTDANEKRKKEIESAIAFQVRAIQKAQERGVSYVGFSVPHQYEREIKEMFTKQGYTFRPTGYIGGVLQITERIHW
jgi:hypothetical protein